MNEKEQSKRFLRRSPVDVGIFMYDLDSVKKTSSYGEVPNVVLCTEHAHAGCRNGFHVVSRLEQYAFLLNVALRRLYFVLKQQGLIPISPGMFTSLALSCMPLRSAPQRVLHQWPP